MGRAKAGYRLIKRMTLDSAAMKALSPEDRLLAAVGIQAVADAQDSRLPAVEREDAGAFIAEIWGDLVESVGTTIWARRPR